MRNRFWNNNLNPASGLPPSVCISFIFLKLTTRNANATKSQKFKLLTFDVLTVKSFNF